MLYLKASEMPPNRIRLIRHAQVEHNLSIENHNIRDHQLTQEGKKQCRNLCQRIEDIESVDCIFASPLRRALHTALYTFEEPLKHKPSLKIYALAELQETSSLPCDTGYPMECLREEFKGKPVDFKLVPPDWNKKNGWAVCPFSSDDIEACGAGSSASA